MCIVAWNWSPGSDQPLILIANRDEYYHRTSQPLHLWDDGIVIAGRDLQAGGTWLGVSSSGRVAALTNHRSNTNPKIGSPSRGTLVSNFLRGSTNSRDYVAMVASDAAEYSDFNLMTFDGNAFMALESRHPRLFEIQPGIAGVCNADFFTPWPKLNRILQGFRELDVQDRLRTDTEIVSLLRDTQTASDATLPITGISIERERVLSSVFVKTYDYGTRASTIVRLGRNTISVSEYLYDAHGPTSQHSISQQLKVQQTRTTHLNHACVMPPAIMDSKP